MKIEVSNTYEEMSEHVADVITKLVNVKKEAVLTIAGGDTPRGIIQAMVRRAKEGRADFSACTFVGLDEWVGLGKEDEGSCAHFLYGELFGPLGISEEQIIFFDARSADLGAECRRVDAEVDKRGGIDLMVLGIGMNGHLGFNEPGADESLTTLVIDLDDTTKTVGQKYFPQAMQLTKGISLGIRRIMAAGEVILIANGAKKSAIIKETVEGAISNLVPSSLARRHPNARLCIDKEAARGLNDNDDAL